MYTKDIEERVKDNTRINVNIKGVEETDINARGPEIPNSAIDELFKKLDNLQSGDTLVLAGSIPASLPSDMYERIMSKLYGKGIKFVVDATKDLLLKSLKYEPFLIKPNNHELGEIFGIQLKNDDEIIYYNSEDPEEDPTIAKAEVTSIHDDDVHTYAIAAVPLV